jgi:hypothetical protein
MRKILIKCSVIGQVALLRYSSGELGNELKRLYVFPVSTHNKISDHDDEGI